MASKNAEAWSFWRDEAKLSVLDPEKRAKVAIGFFAGIVALSAACLLMEYFGAGAAVSRTVTLCAGIIALPATFAVEMFYGGRAAGNRLKEQLAWDGTLAELDRLMSELVNCQNWNHIAASRRTIREFLNARNAKMVWHDADESLRHMQNDEFDRARNAGEVRIKSLKAAAAVLKEYRAELIARQKK